MKPWRPFTWLLLSLCFFVAAAFFWRLGNQWAAKKAATQAQRSEGAGGVAKPDTNHSTLDTRHSNLATQTPALPGSGANRPNANPTIAYRLSNTTNSIGQLARSNKAVLLENALLDTSSQAPLPIPDSLRSHGDPGSYIVQSRGPLDDAFRAALQAAGATIISYIPNNAYLVRISGDGPQQLAGIAQAILPYEPYYKLKSSLLKLAVEQTPIPENTPLNILVFPDARQAALTNLSKMGVPVLGEEISPFGPVFRVSAPNQSLTQQSSNPLLLEALASLTSVQEIETARFRRPANDLSRTNMGVALDTVTTSNYLSLSGSNILVALADTGVDVTHPDLQTPAIKIMGDTPSSLFDTNGHGTHVAGIIAGTGLSSTNVSGVLSNVPGGSILNADFRGKAPQAKLFSIAADPDFGPSYTDIYLQQAAARTNAFISNNSWNYSESQDYDLAAASYDAAVRDALPLVTGPLPLLVVFSAGNDGSGNDDGTGGNGGSVLSPATAKNVITVGAVEQFRTNGFPVSANCTTTNIGGTNFTTCDTNMPFLGSTDSSDQVASFSARGNVGIGIEGDFGRFKPDVVAPGTFVVSTRSAQWDQVSFFGTHQLSHASGVLLAPNGGYTNTFNVPANAQRATISLLHRGIDACATNSFPDLPIFYGPTNSTQATASNTVTIPNPSPNGIDWAYAVVNTSGGYVSVDVLTDVLLGGTNDLTTQALSNIDNTIGPLYRYDSGTSMAAGGVSGVLALMQQFLQDHGRTNGLGGLQGRSPALMKAMLINGAQSLGGLYSYLVTTAPNSQGWGLAQLPTSLHGGLAQATTLQTNSMWLVDQGLTNALVTGQSHIYNISVSQEAIDADADLKVTLVWTDPPANPLRKRPHRRT